jgi:predicted DNA-binding WGR domain protein
VSSGLYLERRDPERRMARFYALHLVPLLFGGWGIVREWGRIGHPGTVRTDWYGTEEEAAAARVRLAAQKARRGYIKIAGRPE